jgi:oligopeptide transport system ATP-binding protein
MVMYGGQIMEKGPTDKLFARPSHPYTKGLLAAVPRLDVEFDVLPTIDGEPPNMLGLPPGCPFSPRCRFKMPHCVETRPSLDRFAEDRARACYAELEEVA